MGSEDERLAVVKFCDALGEHGKLGADHFA